MAESKEIAIRSKTINKKNQRGTSNYIGDGLYDTVYFIGGTEDYIPPLGPA